MKTIRPSDRNLFFNVRRENLLSREHPLKRGNQLTFDLQATQQRQAPSGNGKGDQNTFFRIKQIKQPFLKKREFKDLDPLTRVIGQFPKTFKEKQAAGVLSSIQVISGVLSTFLSTPELNPDGTPKINPLTGQPIVKLRSISEILRVSHESIVQAFKTANVSVSQSMNTLILNMTSEDSQRVLSRLQDVEKDKPSNKDRQELYPDIVINQVLKRPEGELTGIAENAAQRAVNEQKLDLDPTAHFDNRFLSPDKWAALGKGSEGQSAVKQFILKKRDDLKHGLITVNGARLNGFRGMSLNFSQGFWLDLDTLQFMSKKDVPDIAKGIAPAVVPPQEGVLPGF